jgi:osmotically-inducible protein OsmY
MGVHSRVYSRLHWDKSLNAARIEVHMLHDGVVLLRGTVPDAAAKAHAIALARDTLDVTGVVDELETVVPAPAPAARTTNPPVLSVPALTRPSR